LSTGSLPQLRSEALASESEAIHSREVKLSRESAPELGCPDMVQEPLLSPCSFSDSLADPCVAAVHLDAPSNEDITEEMFVKGGTCQRLLSWLMFHGHRLHYGCLCFSSFIIDHGAL
jgi:hypothetical protein